MRKFFLYLPILCLILFNNSFAWEALPHPGNTPRNLFVHTPGEILIVGTFWTGFFRFNPEDETWFLPEYGPGCCNGGITTRCIDSPRVGSDTILATSTEVYGFYNDPPFIIRSEDGGMSWQKSDFGLPTPSSEASYFVAFDPFHPDTVLWGGGHHNLFRSIDCGLNWTQMNSSIGTIATALTWSRQQAGLLFLGTAIINDTTGISGILRSEDHGESYEQVWPLEHPEQGQVMKINDIVEDPFDPGHWLAAVYDYYTTSEHHGDCLLVSSDTGRTWQMNMEGLDNVFLIEDLLADPTTPGRFWATAPQEGVFRSDDGGQSWVHDDEGLGQYDNYKYITMDPSNGELFVSQYKGLLYRKPSLGQRWQPITANPYDSTYPMLTIENNLLVTRNSMGIFASPPPPAWELQQLDNNLFENQGVENHMYFTFNENNVNQRAVSSIYDWRNYKYRLHVSSDNGIQWDEWASDNTLPDCPRFMKFVHADTLMIVGTIEGTIQLVWEDGFEILSGPGLGYIESFKCENNRCLFSINGIVLYSENRGITLHQADIDQGNNPIHFFDGSLDDDGLMIGTGYHENIYLSTDGGHHWFSTDSPCEGTFGYVALGGGFMYVVSYDEKMIFAKEGLNSEWFALDENWPNGFSPIQIVANEHGIAMTGTVNRPDLQRLYYMPTPNSGVSSGWEALPTNYILHAPYPNPFNTETTLSFTLPEPSQVKLTVTNLNGQEVATLTNGEYSYGKHNVHWDASGLASGTYIITMRTPNGGNIARKVQLVK